jgi:hypothetical protein
MDTWVDVRIEKRPTKESVEWRLITIAARCIAGIWPIIYI